MKIQTGHIHLFDIYKFVAEHPKLVSGRGGDTTEYTRLVSKLVESIPAQAGWYNWGRINDVGVWETVYLGKSGNRKTSSLKARIKEELLDERGAFWATVYGTEPTERQNRKAYGGRYPGTRSYRKRNIHFIVWLSADEISEEDIKAEERTLIMLYRPAVNIQRVSYPPHTANTQSILEAFDSEIGKITR